MPIVTAAAIRNLMDIDVEDTRRHRDGVIITLNTSTPIKSFAKLKAQLYSMGELPYKRMEIIEVKEMEAGPLWKRYQIIGKVPDKRLPEAARIRSRVRRFRR